MSTTSIPDPIVLAEEAEKERAQVESEAREIDVLVKQTTSEIDRLQQRQAEMAQRLRQVEANLEAYPREEIKAAYASSQDAQMRLFMMRSQQEQLQNKQRSLQRYRGQLDRLAMTARQIGEASSSVVVTSSGRDRGADQQSIVQIIQAQESERQHLSRQMHDGPAQSLTNLILQAEIVERLFDVDQAKARAELANLKAAANTTFQRIRDFIFDLRPMMLDDLGLIPTLKRYVQTFENKNHVPVHLTTLGERTLPSYIEVAIFRSAQELLNNIARHAHASRVQITLDFQNDPVVMTVEDDGSGFDIESVLASARQRGTSGLANLEKRIQMLGGKVQFQSGTGRGTKSRIELPAAK
ncbi:MAG: sensor histidine kinase [Chloroflexi bacterium]|nr:sensor histidine kinase [Chloroflexota bacterium]